MNNKPPISGNEESSNKTKKRWVILLFSLFIIIISVVSLFYIAENSAEKKLLEWANQELSPNSEIVIDDFSLTLLPLGISIYGVNLQQLQSPEEMTFEKVSDAIRELSIKEITLSGVSLSSLLRREHIQLKRLILHGVHFEAVKLDSLFRSDSTSTDNPIPVSITDIQFSELNLALFDTPLSESPSTMIENLIIDISDFSISDPSQVNLSTYEQLEITADHFTHFTDNGFYEVSLDSFLLQSIDEKLTLDQFRVKPLLTIYEMTLDIGYQLDRFDILIPHFSIEKIDLRRWLSNEELIAGKITLTEPVVSISRDKSIPRREREDRILPHIQFKNLPFVVDIDTIFTDNGKLHYHESIFIENRAGIITFTEIDLSLYSMANHSTSPILAEATALFMDRSEFDLTVEFSMADNAMHSVSGNLDPFDLTAMNSTLENLVNIRLDTGLLQQLNFQFHADDDQANGTLLLIYSDLDLRFLDPEQLTERRWDRIRSFVANTFVIISGNSAEDPRSGKIDFERDKERSIFNYWLGSISTGLVDTIKR